MDQTVKPYEYQEPIIAAIEESLERTGKALVDMATGTGKTITVALAVKKRLKRGKRVLVLCHNSDILDHDMKEFRAVFGEYGAFGVYTGELKSNWKDAQLVFATFQAMLNAGDFFRKNDFDIVVVDEGHHGQAPTFKEVILRFAPTDLIGMTATVERLDRKDIRELFGPVIYELPLAQAIAKGFVTPVDYRLMTIGSLADGALKKLLQEEKSGGRRLSVAELNRTLFIEKMDDEIVKVLEEIGGRQIIFCQSTNQADHMAEKLSSAGAYHTNLLGNLGQNSLDGFKACALQKLLVKDKFNEGVNIPDADVVVFLRSTQSPTIFIQQLGRGLRRALGKKKVIVLDFVANVERIEQVLQMVERIKEFASSDEAGEDKRKSSNREMVVLRGDGYDFSIDQQSLDIFALLQRMRVDICSYEEACVRVRRMGIKNRFEYRLRYREDPCLPCNPFRTYGSTGWVSWKVFLNSVPYSYKEASAKAQKMGIKQYSEYVLRYKEDPRLPSNPAKIYASTGWVSWKMFLGSVFYSYKEAVAKVREMGIKTSTEYLLRYKEDPRLPCNPAKIYASTGWVSFPVFLGTAK